MGWVLLLRLAPPALMGAWLAANIAGLLELVWNILFGILIMITTGLAVEEIVSRWGIAKVFNVLVMSWIAAIPQTVIAVVYALNGKYLAAYLDAMASTLIDAIIISYILGRPVHRAGPSLAATAGLVALMTIWALFTPLSGREDVAVVGAVVFFVLGAVLIPLMLVWGEWGAPRVEPRDVPMLLMEILVLAGAAYTIGAELVGAQLGEGALGILGAVIGTSPDFALAVILLLAGRPAEEAIETMIAAAIHDQLSGPALVVLIGGLTALVDYPSWFAVAVMAHLFAMLWWEKTKHLLVATSIATLLWAWSHAG